MNISAMFQVYRPSSFWGIDFLYIFRKFSIFVPMTTKEIEDFWQILYHSTKIDDKTGKISTMR